MSEKRAHRKRLEAQAQSAQPPSQGEQPAQSRGTTTIADLLQLLGAKDVEILGLQRQVAGLQQQVQTLAKALQERSGEPEGEPEDPKKPMKSRA